MTWAPCPHGVRTRGKKKEKTYLRQPYAAFKGIVFFHKYARRVGEIQSDGGEKDKDNPTTKSNNQKPKGRVSTIPLC